MSNEVTENDARKILEASYPEEEVISVNRINEGFSHFMYDCHLSKSGNVVVRIGFNKKDEFHMAKEVWITNKYFEYNIPVPKIHHYDFSRSVFPFDYSVISKLPGQCLNKIWNTLNDEEKVRACFRAGEFLRKIHSIPMEHFGKIGSNGLIEHHEFSFRNTNALKMDPWSKLFLEILMVDLSLLMTAKLITSEESAKFTKFMHDNIHLTENAKPTLIHNDFHLDHLFVERSDSDFKIVGICDLEFASSYAPEYDFIKLHRIGFFDDVKLRKALLDGYGADKVHPNFDKLVQIYRISRDMPFAYLMAKNGNMELFKKVWGSIMQRINQLE